MSRRALPGIVAGYIRGMDALSRGLGHVASVCVLAACAVSAAVALVRYGLSMGSNAWLEIQWYLFAATVFLGAPALVQLNEHVRVDVIYGGRRPRTRAWIDLLGFVVFYLPVCAVLLWTSFGFAHDAWASGEMSNSAGGLVRWPVKALIPLGFALLLAQGLAEVLKRVGYLTGRWDMPAHYERPLQ